MILARQTCFCGALRSDTIASSRRRSSGVTLTVIPAHNGKLHVSQRIAMRELGSSSNQIARRYRENQFYGFMVMTKGVLVR